MAFTVRTGTVADAPVVLAFFDDAVRWLNARGIVDQWGTEPFSAVPKRVDAATAWAAGGGLRIAQRDGVDVGALVVGEAPAYVPPAEEPELYVVALVTARTPEARGAGRFLLDVAADEALRRGVDLLRVDCFAGSAGDLVSVYERAGFTPTERFTVGAWPGQVLVRRLAAPPA